MERTYNVPLRKDFSKAPRHKRAHRAMTSLRGFLMQHMKCSNEQIRIGKVLNDTVWARGIKNPPHHVKITAIKQDDGIVKVELFGHKYPEPIKPVSKEDKPKKEEKKSDDKVVDAETVEEKPKKAKAKKTETAKEDEASEEKADVKEESEEKPKKTVKKTAKKEESSEEKPKKTAKKSSKKEE